MRQKDLAGLVGVKEETIANWEGARSLPRDFRKVKKACETLTVDFEEIVDKFCLQTKGQEKRFGKQLLRTRILKGLTQEQVARLVGIDPSTLARWESGEGWPLKKHLQG